jgi:hypothetical protein
MATSINTNIPIIASRHSDDVARSEAKAAYDSLADENGVIREVDFIQWFIKSESKGVKRTLEATSSTASVSASAGPAAKKPKATPISGALPPFTLAPIMNAARKKALLKGLVTTLKASIKSKKWYSDASIEDCNSETVMSEVEFQSLFGNIGKAKADAKASSVVIAKTFTSEETAQLFGALLSGLKTMTYNKPRNFSKQVRVAELLPSLLPSLPNTYYADTLYTN